MAKKSLPNTTSLYVPPHNLDAERSVLGALLIDKDSIVKVVEFLRPRHFYKDSHQNIFQAIFDLYEKRDPADLVTVPSVLKERNLLDKCGGVSYLTDLVNSVPTAANIETYARIIKDAALKRALITAAAQINEMVFSEADLSKLLDRSE